MQFTTFVVMALASLAAAVVDVRQVGSATESTTYVPTTVTLKTKVPETTVYYTGTAPASMSTSVANGTNTFLGPIATNATNLTSTGTPPVATGAAAALSPLGAAAGAIVIMAGVLGAL